MTIADAIKVALKKLEERKVPPTDSAILAALREMSHLELTANAKVIGA